MTARVKSSKLAPCQGGEMGIESIQQAKTDLLRRAAHRARNSLNGVIGLAELLRWSGVSQDASVYSSIGTSAGELKSVLQPLLDIAIADPRMPGEPRPFPIRPLLHELAEFQQILARERQVLVSSEVSEEVPPTLCADRLKFTLLVHLLVARVVAAADAGRSVTIGMKAEGGRCRLSIAHAAPPEAGATGALQERQAVSADLGFLDELVAALDADVTAEGSPGASRIVVTLPLR